MNCPKCNSGNVEETGKFDLTLVSNTECVHDFECQECGCLFTITFHPISSKIVQDHFNDDD